MQTIETTLTSTKNAVKQNKQKCPIAIVGSLTCHSSVKTLRHCKNQTSCDRNDYIVVENLPIV